jgi:hypothetical protein
LANITSSLLKLPPSLQTYLDAAVDQLSGAAEYVQSATGLSPTALYSTAGVILVIGAIPTVFGRSTRSKPGAAGPRKGGLMSRYGWSTREPISPYNSDLGGAAPEVTSEDFSYITSEELENYGLDDRPRVTRERRGTGSQAPQPASDDRPEDDVLQIKSKGVTYPQGFPAFSIGDGKLLVSDVRDRVQLFMKLSERRARHVRMLYKGRELKDPTVPIRAYGVKNNSEIMVVLGDADDSSDDSSEEIVVVGRGDDDDDSNDRKKSKKKDKKRKSKRRRRDSDRSPPDSGSNLEVPPRERGPGSSSRAQSPASAVSGASSSAGGPIDKLNSISSHFTTKLLPLCVQFTASPPTDAKKREDEHRKLSETVMQQVLLKLDEVETAGDEEARTRRRELVRQVQDVLKGLDGQLRDRNSST